MVLTTNNHARYNEHKVLFSTEYPPKVSKLNRFHPNHMYLYVIQNHLTFFTPQNNLPQTNHSQLFGGPLCVCFLPRTVLSKHRVVFGHVFTLCRFFSVCCEGDIVREEQSSWRSMSIHGVDEGERLSFLGVCRRFFRLFGGEEHWFLLGEAENVFFWENWGWSWYLLFVSLWFVICYLLFLVLLPLPLLLLVCCCCCCCCHRGGGGGGWWRWGIRNISFTGLQIPIQRWGFVTIISRANVKASVSFFPLRGDWKGLTKRVKWETQIVITDTKKELKRDWFIFCWKPYHFGKREKIFIIKITVQKNFVKWRNTPWATHVSHRKGAQDLLYRQF